MKVDNAGWLVQEAGDPQVLKVQSIRVCTLDVPAPLGIVWHWTGGRCTTPTHAPALADSIRTYDKSKDTAASWNILIAKDGRIFQSVPVGMGSWHVGKPGRIGGPPVKMPDGKWDATQFAPGKLLGNINRGTVGVELENSGRLIMSGGKFYAWPYWKDPANPSFGPDANMEIVATRAVEVPDDGFFDEFPAAQEDAARRLLAALVVKYGWNRDVSRYGHVMFDSPRKEDPGPVWLNTVLPRILNAVFGAQP